MSGARRLAVRFGIVSPPVPGHIHPFGALGRELIERGHRVTLFHMADLQEAAAKEGLDFEPMGQLDHPPGSLPQSLALLGQRKGLSALRFTINAVHKTTEMMFRDLPGALREARIDFLLVDQMEPAGGTVAEHLGLPFVTVCNALMLNREPDVPPPFTPWVYSKGWCARARNWLGYAGSEWMMHPVTDTVARYRSQWGLPPLKKPDDSFSRLAQISQQPPRFDFPRQELPPALHYVGPLRKASARAVPFPWERLDGRPLIYASLGTLQNNREKIFRCFAEACQGIDAQLVITHGGGLDEDAASRFPPDVVLVNYAPQLELLARAQLTLSHAGLNTVLDSLTFGVPVIAIPITYEQPAIAERLRWTGAGKTMKLSTLDAASLRSAIQTVLNDHSFRSRAKEISDSIRQSGGVQRAATIIERLATGV